MWKRGEIAPKEQFLLFSTLFYVYISNLRSQITYSFVKCACSIYCFPQSLNWYVEVQISRSVSASPFEFEIIDWLCWGLTTRQPLRVILCRLPEKGRKEIEERVEEMKEGQGRKRNRNESEETEEIKTFPLYPYPLQG